MSARLFPMSDTFLAWLPLPCVDWTPIGISQSPPSPRSALRHQVLHTNTAPSPPVDNVPGPSPAACTRSEVSPFHLYLFNHGFARSPSLTATRAIQFAASFTSSSLSEFVKNGHAWSTQSQYRCALQLYCAVCAAHGVSPSPVDSRSLVLLIGSMTKAGYAFSTITKYCSQVRNAARLNNTLRLNDADQATIQLAMRSAERQLGSATARALTLSKEQVLQVATELDRVRVDFADGFLVGTMGLLRVAEMLYIRAQDVDPFATTADGIPVCGATLKITRSKCDQGAKGVWRPLPCTSSPRVNLPTVCSSRFCAAHLLLRRAAAANNMTDRLFPFSNSAFSAHLRSAMATVIGQPNESVRLSSHTMRRSGSAICCDAPNFSVPLVAEFGRWSTADTLQNVYLRDNAHAFNRFVSGLLVAWGS